MTHLDVDLVTAENDGDVLADTLEVSVPVGDVLVGDSRGDIKHDDTALSLDVVSVSETTKLLLSSSVPDVEADGTKVGVEGQRVDLDTERGCILVRRGGVSEQIEGEGWAVPMYFFSNSPAESQLGHHSTKKI